MSMFIVTLIVFMIIIVIPICALMILGGKTLNQAVGYVFVGYIIAYSIFQLAIRFVL